MSEKGSLILPAIIAISVFLICMIALYFSSKQDSLRERMRRMVSGTTPEENEPKALVAKEEYGGDSLSAIEEYSPLGKTLESVLNALGVDTETYRKDSQLVFYRAGIASPDAPIFFLFFKRIGVFFFLLVGGLLLFSQADGTMERLLHWMGAFFLIVMGVYGPELLLKNKRANREKVLQRSFPDALDLLLVCVDSGLALDGALSRVCKELRNARPEIAQELNRTRMELTLLNDRTQALNNLAERTDMLAFRSLVTTLLQSERFGTSLTDTLRVLSEDYRHARLMLAEEKAGRLPVMMTIPLITLMMPALFLIILGPAIIKVVGLMTGQK